MSPKATMSQEVVARLTSAADQGPSPETIVDEIVNFGLRGIFYDQARGLWGLMSMTKGPEKGGESTDIDGDRDG
jgi:hypothetical protein